MQNDADDDEEDDDEEEEEAKRMWHLQHLTNISVLYRL